MAIFTVFPVIYPEIRAVSRGHMRTLLGVRDTLGAEAHNLGGGFYASIDFRGSAICSRI
jgi:hypothetical protein